MLHRTSRCPNKPRLLLVVATFCLSWGQANPVRAQDIHEAIRAGDLEAVDRILARNPAPLRTRNAAGREPIHEAIFWGNLPILEFLVSRGAGVNVLAGADNSTLHWAVHAMVGPEERGAMVEFLLAQSPSLARARNINGLTPLHWAGNELPQTVHLLLENGAGLPRTL